MEENWHLKLFSKSVLKQRKWKEIKDYLGATEGFECLDIGSDNGVISYLLRKVGGLWSSADLNDEAVESIQSLVGEHVYKIDGEKTDFKDNQFDKVVIVDFLEHIQKDKEFITEIYRFMKPDGELIINVPHLKNSLLRKFRLFIGQTDEKHGHLRPGYTVKQLEDLLGDKFRIINTKTYSRFFSEFIDSLITFGYGLLQNKQAENTNSEKSKGVLITEENIKKYKKSFRIYSLIYPFVWMFAKLDMLLFFRSGYLLMLKTKINKPM